ncbi:hypothetical protein OIU83_06740 [Flavobacterium sp. LS1R49]|uniref:Uncharacterized protein n=1 Tax=Flavobacterium shii TaxID=2987687 RepID=A0A9X3BXJ8_9FLAO|nr:hypothetical protein [Flavobacterium shii]MCV9927340.1 hypothetical protein [Flavobacterium shii]
MQKQTNTQLNILKSKRTREVIFISLSFLFFCFGGYSQQKNNNVTKANTTERGSHKSSKVNVDFEELFRLLNNEIKEKKSLLKSKSTQVLLKSNDKNALDVFLKNNKKVLGMTVVNDLASKTNGYYQLDLNVSYSAYHVEVVVSEVSGLIVTEKEKYWISMPNIQLY